MFDEKAEIYNRHGINFRTLQHLESIGLIQHATVVGFLSEKVPKRLTMDYYGRLLNLEPSKEANNKLKLGKVALTSIGRELAPICGGKPVDGFWEYVRDQWKQYLPKSETE